MPNSLIRTVAALVAAGFFAAPAANAQHTGHAGKAGGDHSDHAKHGDHANHGDHADMKAMAAHMEVTPRRPGSSADSSRAAAVARELRTSILKYQDVKQAVADGFRQFAPQLKNQRVYHFTNYGSAFVNAFRFDPAKPTSLLYKKDARGNFVLTGGMYTAPKNASAEDLDKRVPLSVAQWHKHVNWCLPGRGEQSRWAEKKNGRPVFGPLGVATRKECEDAGGRFHEEVFGWMVHASVFEGNDPETIWGDDHMMAGDEMMEHKH